MKTNKNIQHTQLSGQAHYDDDRYFMFTPDDPQPGQVTRYRRMGVAQQMPDGTFDFTAVKRMRYITKLIKKLRHGRLSQLHDGTIKLTLTFAPNDLENIDKNIRKEGNEAINAYNAFAHSAPIPGPFPPEGMKGVDGSANDDSTTNVNININL